jgi:hypothetical protein
MWGFDIPTVPRAIAAPTAPLWSEAASVCPAWPPPSSAEDDKIVGVAVARANEFVDVEGVFWRAEVAVAVTKVVEVNRGSNEVDKEIMNGVVEGDELEVFFSSSSSSSSSSS